MKKIFLHLILISILLFLFSGCGVLPKCRISQSINNSFYLDRIIDSQSFNCWMDIDPNP